MVLSQDMVHIVFFVSVFMAVEACPLQREAETSDTRFFVPKYHCVMGFEPLLIV